MPRRRNPFPTPRQHKGAAVVDVYDGPTRRTVTLGPWGSEQAQEEYERLLARLRVGKSAIAVASGSATSPANMTVAEALVRYTDHIERHYLDPVGNPTGTADDIKITLGYLRRLAELKSVGVSRGPGRRGEFPTSHRRGRIEVSRRRRPSTTGSTGVPHGSPPW